MQQVPEKIFMILKENRIDSPVHRRYVASLPSMIAGVWNETVVDHHLLKAHQTKGIGLKSCDMYCVPLTDEEHRSLHAHGDEIKWFEMRGWPYEDVKSHALMIALDSPCKKVRAKAIEYLDNFNQGE